MRFKKLLVIGISVAIVFSVLPLQVLADDIADSFKCRSLNEASYTVQENVITEWPGHANIEIVFTNTGDTTIYNWNYSFDYPYSIENPYCCSIVEHEGDLYTITNAGWNKDINPGESVTIGFTASSNDGSNIEVMPSFYLLNNEQTTLPESAVTVEYQEYSDWTTGSSGVLILSNNTENAIGSWTLSFFANRPITDAYGFTLSSNDDGAYTITGDGYTEIPAGGSVQIGIQCGEHDSSVLFEVTDVSIYSSMLATGLNEDSNGNGVPDVEEIDSTGFIEINTLTPTAEPTTTETPTDTPTDTPEPTPTEFVFTPDQDLDGDGLYTSEEEMYGTDPNNPDSDGDGVSDGYEIRMMYFPTIADSDSDGVVDGDEDFDGDGIINRDEESYGTCPYAADSDYDGINDYDEIFTYGTDPYEEDSDGDYILDGDELALGLDPTTDTTESVQDNENTQDYAFTSTSEQIAEYNTDDQPFSFSFDITAAGRVDKYIKVQETGYKYALEENTTVLGKSPEIVYDKNMKVDSVTVRFILKNGYESDIEKYSVFYYWEGYNILIPIETEYDYDTGTVYATNTMIGTYCLVDTDQMYGLLGIEKEEQVEKNLSKTVFKNEEEETEQNSDSTYSLGDKKTYNGHEYFLITSDTPMLYDEAVAVCNTYGGYPAVITSAEENSFIASISNAAWIGGSVRFHGISTPTVDWITGEDCTYTYWGFGSYNANDFPKWEGFPLTTAGVWGWNWRDPETYTETRVICECDTTGYSVSALTFGEETIELNNQSDSDIDGDGLLDYEELSEYDLGVFDSFSGNYTPAKFAQYGELALGNGINADAERIELLGKFSVSSFKSSVFSANRDDDTAIDTEDTDGYYNNQEMIYILYVSPGYDYSSAYYVKDYSSKNDAYKLYSKYTDGKKLNCQINSFWGYSDFVDCWGHIGNDMNISSSVPCEYLYDVTDVIIIAHCDSNGGAMSLGKGEYLCPEFTEENRLLFQEINNYYFIEDISIYRQFESLDLLVCDSAIQLEPDSYMSKNLAESFICHFPSILQVFAFDCNCGLSEASGDVAWVGSLIMSDYPNLDACNYCGQVLYFRGSNGQKYDVDYDLYEGNIDIFFSGSPYRAEINAKDNNYFDPVFYYPE